MFENIISQDATVEQLSKEWREGTLPRALLFYGEPYSAKLSTALELARVLTCREKGEWSCSCRSCRQHRVLDHPYIVLTGSRFLVEEIAAAADTLLRTRREGARFLFIRAVRKLSRRLDPLLWEGEEQKLKKFQSSIEELEEEVEALYPGKELAENKELEASLEKINELAVKVSDLLPKDNIPIDQIRSIGMWSHTTSADSAKVVIFENADRMSDGSKNALLKMLEEPPEATYFILLTSKRGAIIPTIQSRVRQYRFVPRDEESSRAVMEKIFRIGEEVPYRDLRAFFLAWRGIPVEKLRQEAHRFVEGILRGEAWEPKEKTELLKELGSNRLFVPFLEELTLEMRRRLFGEEPEVSTRILQSWTELMRDSYLRWEAYNQSPELLLETLHYDMEEKMEAMQ